MGIRCFIAIPLGDRLKKEIGILLEDLKKMNTDVKWVPPENVHITLKFLGDTDEDTLPVIQEKLSLISDSQRAFTVELSGMGFFPDERSPRVVWIDLKDYEELNKLKQTVDEKLITMHFKKEDRHFSPHLTIGRVRTPKNLSTLLAAVETLKDRDFGNIEVKLISLMKSELRPKGAEYTTIAEFNLKEE